MLPKGLCIPKVCIQYIQYLSCTYAVHAQYISSTCPVHIQYISIQCISVNIQYISSSNPASIRLVGPYPVVLALLFTALCASFQITYCSGEESKYYWIRTYLPVTYCLCTVHVLDMYVLDIYWILRPTVNVLDMYWIQTLDRP